MIRIRHGEVCECYLLNVERTVDAAERHKMTSALAYFGAEPHAPRLRPSVC